MAKYSQLQLSYMFMDAQILDGKLIAKQLTGALTKEISLIKNSGKRLPCLAVILVGHDPASLIYVKNKQMACQEIGILSKFLHLNQQTTTHKLIDIITELNSDPQVDGILLQLPLPAQINQQLVLAKINPQKDVDGFHPYNIGCIAHQTPIFEPCTPLGIMKLLAHTGISLPGKHAVIIGASIIVGKPLALYLINEECTVTICNKETTNLARFVQSADIVIAAAGKPQLVKGSWIKANSVVIDVGINRVADNNIIGDVEFEVAATKASWITPVPGGVGPMTVACLLSNTLKAYLALSC